jgi:hypothetical protein
LLFDLLTYSVVVAEAVADNRLEEVGAITSVKQFVDAVAPLSASNQVEVAVKHWKRRTDKTALLELAAMIGRDESNPALLGSIIKTMGLPENEKLRAFFSELARMEADPIHKYYILHVLRYDYGDDPLVRGALVDALDDSRSASSDPRESSRVCDAAAIFLVDLLDDLKLLPGKKEEYVAALSTVYTERDPMVEKVKRIMESHPELYTPFQGEKAQGKIEVPNVNAEKGRKLRQTPRPEPKTSVPISTPIPTAGAVQSTPNSHNEYVWISVSLLAACGFLIWLLKSKRS